MPLPDRDGRFRAYPVAWTVEEKDNGVVNFVCNWRIVQWYGDKQQEWFDFDGYEITSWTVLVKKDGGLNQSGVDQLKEALGWDGVDLPALARSDWSQRGCSLWTQFDTWQNKTRIKVQWVDAWDATGSGGGFTIKQADESVLSSLQSKFGGQLRAMSPQADTSKAPKKAPPPPPRPKEESPADVDESDIPF